MTDSSPQLTPTLDPRILDICVCPITHSKLRQEGPYLISTVGDLKYPIHDGIPVLLPQEAILPPEYPTLESFRAHFLPT